jgi:hypothetical protein
MRRVLLCLARVGLVQSAAREAHAQAVQLPTFHYFTVQTTVSVPDRGGVVLGGVNRASSGSTSRGFGPLRNRASGSSIGASSASVHATIIDHAELDAEVLAEAARRRALAAPLVKNEGWSVRDERITSKAEHLSRHVTARDEPRSAPTPIAVIDSVAAVRARAAARDQAKQAEAAAKLAAGIAAEEAGKFASARGYYEAAARLGGDEIRSEAAARLAKIALPAPKTQRVVTSP